MKKIILLILVSAVTFTACQKSSPKVVADMFSSSFNFQKKVKKNVKDKKNREKVLLLIRDNGITLKELFVEYVELQKKVRNNPEIAENELRKMLKEFSGKRKKTLLNVSRNRLEMRKYITEKEWNKIVKVKKSKNDKKEKL